MTAPRPAPIEVIKVKPLENGGNLRAFASVRIGAVVIHSVRIIQQPGQKAWCSMPQSKSGDKWYALVEITSKELKDRVSAAVLDAWEQQA
jgi:DNA-binding cell septation regulator SpoVG